MKVLGVAGGGIGSVASISLKSVNQDACAVIHRLDGHAAVLVADGIGSHFRADVASSLVINTVAAALAALETVTAETVRELFASAGEALDAEAEATRDVWPEGVTGEEALGTTLLCAIDTPRALLVAYAGNGALLHVRGDFSTFPPTQLMPWTAMNYLNPHTRWEQGRNALYKFLAPNQAPIQREPTVLTISRDDHLVGDIVIVCSDGICSYDQTPIGRDADRRIWIAGDATLPPLYEALTGFFAKPNQNEAALECVLRTYLDSLVSQDLVTDDCTLGVLITERTLTFHRERRLVAKSVETRG